MNTFTKQFSGVAGLFAAISTLPFFLISPGRSTEEQRRPFAERYFAHRGLHTKDHTVPENSPEAFRLAAEAGYGIELDVQLSKDGHVMVFHDDTLNRVCGVDSPVCEKTFAELSRMPLYDTSQTIPLFSEVLHLVDGRSPLIVELKTGNRNKELCRKTLEHLKFYTGPVCIESFDPCIVAWFRIHAPQYLRGQLSMPASRYSKNVPRIMRYLMSRCMFSFLARPQFIAYRIGEVPCSVRIARKLGAMDIAWTSHKESDHIGRDAVIFEYYKPEPTYCKTV